MDYDLYRIGLSVYFDGEMVHVYADRDNKTGRRSVFLVRSYSVYVCHMTGNPADKDEFKVEETRPVNREEAEWLLGALIKAGHNPEMGFKCAADARLLFRKVRDATFWVRYQSEPSVVTEV